MSGIYLLLGIRVIDGWVRRWRSLPRWSGWALSHCAMIAAAIPDPHHHFIDTKPTANLLLARCLWHRLHWSCLDYHPASSWRMSNTGEEHCVHKHEDKFVCLSLPSSRLIFPFFSYVVLSAAKASPVVHVLSGEHRENKTAQEHYPMFK